MREPIAQSRLLLARGMRACYLGHSAQSDEITCQTIQITCQTIHQGYRHTRDFHSTSRQANFRRGTKHAGRGGCWCRLTRVAMSSPCQSRPDLHQFAKYAPARPHCTVSLLPGHTLITLAITLKVMSVDDTTSCPGFGRQAGARGSGGTQMQSQKEADTQIDGHTDRLTLRRSLTET